MSSSSDHSVLSEQLTDVLILINQVLRKHRSYIQDRYNLSSFDMELLFFLMHQESLRMKDIAQHFGVKLSTLTSIVDKAEKLEIVERVHSQGDRRVVYLRTKRKGKKIVADFQEFHRQVASQMKDRMEASEFEAFTKSLKILISGVGARYFLQE